MFVNGGDLSEQSLQRTFQGCFLPNFNSFGQAVSEEKIFQKSTNQKQELPVAAMFVIGSGQNEQSLQRTFHRCFLPRFGSFGQAVSEEKIFFKSTNQKQELPVATMFVNGSEINEHHYRGPSIDASYQVSVHLAKRFQRRFFRNQPIRNKNSLWWPCLLTIGMKRAMFIENSPQILSTKIRFIWPSGFRGEDFLEINQSEIRIGCGGNVC